MRWLTGCIILTAFSSTASAEVETGSREALLDNEAVEVIRLTYPPGSEPGMHTHEYPNRAACFVAAPLFFT